MRREQTVTRGARRASPRRGAPLVRRAALIVVAGLSTGCYVPALAEPTTLTPDDDLRVILTTEAQQRQNGAAPLEGRGEVRGRFMRLTDDSLTIATRLPRTAPAGLALPDVRRPVTFAREDIREITVPRLDRGRTGLLVGAAAVLLAVVIGDLFDIRGDGDAPPPPSSPDPGSPFAGRR
jgi:hypothetical protein